MPSLDASSPAANPLPANAEQIAMGVSPAEFLEGSNALFDQSSNKWRTANGNIIQTRGALWYDFARSKGGRGPISLAQLAYGCKTREDACELIRAVCPGPFLASQEMSLLQEQTPSAPASAAARAKGAL